MALTWIYLLMSQNFKGCTFRVPSEHWEYSCDLFLQLQLKKLEQVTVLLKM